MRGSAVVLALALAACGPVELRDDVESAPPPVSLDAESLAGADLERGELLSLACQACHSFTADRDLPLGPNLSGVFGRKAGVVPGFDYSDVMRRSGIVWTPELLDAWLEDPAGYLPGTNMTFSGYGSPTDRRDLIAYLMSATAADSSSDR